jgi:hypothetical protein
MLLPITLVGMNWENIPIDYSDIERIDPFDAGTTKVIMKNGDVYRVKDGPADIEDKRIVASGIELPPRGEVR